MGLGCYYKYINIGWYGKDNPIDPNDPEMYGGAQARPQYRRAAVFFDLDHPAWKDEQEEGTIDNGVRHELIHLMQAPLTQFAERIIETIADKQVQAMLQAELNDMDDLVVSRWEHAPFWDALD